MKLCKVKPSGNRCMVCTDNQITLGNYWDCSRCEVGGAEYELISVGTSFWTGDYAFVMKDGRIERVELKRVYDVREVVVGVDMSTTVDVTSYYPDYSKAFHPNYDKKGNLLR